MKLDVSKEIIFSTARSGGKGGQNVNKVETKVEGRWHIASSLHVNEEQSALIQAKLSNRINKEGFLVVKSQEDRTQLGNKEIVTSKINELINTCLLKKKSRIASKTPKSVIEKRLNTKKIKSFLKQNRRKIINGEY